MSLSDLFDSGQDEILLRCPVCAGTYVHHEVTVEYRRDKEDGPVTRAVVGRNDIMTERVDDRENPSLRRDAVVLSFRCEGGHDFSFQVIQHKGETFLRTQQEDRDVS